MSNISDLLIEPEDVFTAEFPPCPICGDPIDYCLGHGPIGNAMLGISATIEDEWWNVEPEDVR